MDDILAKREAGLCECEGCQLPAYDDGIYGKTWCDACLNDISALGGCNTHDPIKGETNDAQE